MKILVDLTSLADNFSGIERFALSITKELILNKNNKYILLFKENVHKDFRCVGENVECIELPRYNKLVFQQMILPLKLLTMKADYYFFPAFPAPFLFFKKKSINTIHDVSCWDCPTTNKKYMSLYFKILYRKAALFNKKIITVSNFSKERIEQVLKVKSSNIVVAYNGISQELFAIEMDEHRFSSVREKYKLPSKYILCLSTLEPRKNLQLLVKAFSDLAQQESDINLVLAGRKGWLVDDLLQEIDEKIQKRISLTGFIEDEDLPYIYKMSECFVFPSLYEGFGIPPLEALTMGCPVISSDAASMPEILKDAALYFESNNLEALKESILCMRNLDAESKQELIAKGLVVSKMYSWRTSANIINDLFKSKDTRTKLYN